MDVRTPRRVRARYPEAHEYNHLLDTPVTNRHRGSYMDSELVETAFGRAVGWFIAANRQ
jgi:hypothetical protein